jgi:hypothetical protein
MPLRWSGLTPSRFVGLPLVGRPRRGDERRPYIQTSGLRSSRATFQFCGRDRNAPDRLRRGQECFVFLSVRFATSATACARECTCSFS